MILTSLVNPDPGGFVQLDENLGRHIGRGNVEAFHAEAGDVTINECLNNPVIVREMQRNAAIQAQFTKAIGEKYSVPRNDAFGASDAALLRNVLTPGKAMARSGVETFPSIQVRAIVANEIITNPVVNDAMMRNPTIMRELTNAVTKLYQTRSAEFEPSGRGGKKPGRRGRKR